MQTDERIFLTLLIAKNVREVHGGTSSTTENLNPNLNGYLLLVSALLYLILLLPLLRLSFFLK